MDYYAGIDLSLEASSVCIVDASGKILREAKVLSQPDNLIGWFRDLGLEVTRIGLEAGPLSQWLYTAMKKEGLAVELLVTRHVHDAFKAMPVKSDRNDAVGLVPAGSLQVDTGPRSARATDGAQAGSVEADGH
jgi:transposase